MSDVGVRSHIGTRIYGVNTLLDIHLQQHNGKPWIQTVPVQILQSCMQVYVGAILLLNRWDHCRYADIELSTLVQVSPLKSH